MRVQLYYLGGRNAANLRVSVRAGNTTESVSVGSSGGVALGSQLVLGDSVEIRVEETGTPTSRFHPAIAIVRRVDLEDTQKFVLIPRRWTIAAAVTPCRYAGQTVDIDLELAYTRSISDPSSFYWRTPASDGGWTYRTAAFPRSAMPIPVAFNHATSTDRISGLDSAAFWSTVTELESELCEHAFQPATIGTMTPGRGVTVFVDRELDAFARGGPISDSNGGRTELVGGAVICRTTTCIASPETVRHELLHVLGFGHSCSWPTIMRAGCTGASRASEQDVAYFQVYYAARAMQLANGAQHSLAAAHQGQRVIMRGLPIDPVAQIEAQAGVVLSNPSASQRSRFATRSPVGVRRTPST